MLRIPVVDQLSYAPFPYILLVGTLMVTFLISIGTSLVGARRLRISRTWAFNLIQNGRPVNEILYAIGQMLFPIKGIMVIALILHFTLDSHLNKEVHKSFNLAAMLVMGSLLFGISLFEQSLIQKLRKIESGIGPSGRLAIRLLVGQFATLIAALIITLCFVTTRRAYLPLGDWDAGLTRQFEFLAAFVFTQLLISPVILRMMLPSHKPKTEEEIETAKITVEAFQQLGLNRPQIRILDLNHLKIYNALIAGLNSAPWYFRQIVMISCDPQVSLNHNETRAIIHHELAHGVLWHIPVRIVSSVALLLLCGLALFFMSETLHFWPAVEDVLFLLVILAIFPLLAGRIVREQELQADEFAVNRLGTSRSDLISALTKLTIASGGLLDRHPAGAWLIPAFAHPTVLEREFHLNQLATHPAQPNGLNLSPMRALIAFFRSRPGQVLIAANIILFAVWSNSYLIRTAANREPASLDLNAIHTKLIEARLRSKLKSESAEGSAVRVHHLSADNESI
jgi:Zn-dependent protease with chaperone function